jgi:hypothetical protein
VARRLRPSPHPAAPVGPGGVHPLRMKAPLSLQPADVACVGVVRAAFDAVAACPDVARYRLAAQGDRDALAALSQATADLARRTVVAYATSVAAFTRSESPPPF